MICTQFTYSLNYNNKYTICVNHTGYSRRLYRMFCLPSITRSRTYLESEILEYEQRVSAYITCLNNTHWFTNSSYYV